MIASIASLERVLYTHYHKKFFADIGLSACFYSATQGSDTLNNVILDLMFTLSTLVFHSLNSVCNLLSSIYVNVFSPMLEINTNEDALAIKGQENPLSS